LKETKCLAVGKLTHKGLAPSQGRTTFYLISVVDTAGAVEVTET